MNSEENPEENSESNSENNLLNLIVNKASAHLNLNRRARVVISAKMRVRSGIQSLDAYAAVQLAAISNRTRLGTERNCEGHSGIVNDR